MLSAFTNSLKIPELRQRIFFTCALLFLCRMLAVIPLPGVDVVALQGIVDRITQGSGVGFLGLLDLFSGGALTAAAIGALGIMPSISASIILQLMTAVIPSLERLAREGDSGRQKIIQYGRYLTVFLCVVQGFGFAAALLHPSRFLGAAAEGTRIVLLGNVPFLLLAVLAMTTGTMLLMWFGEQITARGIGNGISLIITVSIVSRLPGAIEQTIAMFHTGDANIFKLIVIIALAFLVTAGVVAVTQAQRKIPVQYAKRVVGRKTYGGQSTYMPLRVNYSGVMPIIFASAILMFLGRVLEWIPFTKNFAQTHLTREASFFYIAIYGLLILFFSYFWVATQFHPVQIADDLKKYGGYVPGIRPGKPTAEYLDKTMTRITLAGAIFLTIIAVLPIILLPMLKIPQLVAQFFGGTSLLIIVGVMLDTMRQVESHLVTRHYDGFLRKGHLRSRR
ncbi:MAG: preprotein translocase subunit SecY [Kiritimatiellae bacterium]|nr:preprotein translocase subunit SecY [Kiritimatiellia bacterium]MBQ9344364.1 preprotein translocase subunit SecY [Kiritimatiellia bacterium]